MIPRRTQHYASFTPQPNANTKTTKNTNAHRNTMTTGVLAPCFAQPSRIHFIKNLPKPRGHQACGNMSLFPSCCPPRGVRQLPFRTPSYPPPWVVNSTCRPRQHPIKDLKNNPPNKCKKKYSGYVGFLKGTNNCTKMESMFDTSAFYGF